jgi:hypothetical protein
MGISDRLKDALKMTSEGKPHNNMKAVNPQLWKKRKCALGANCYI